MYNILACSEYHYFINFIVDLGGYRYSLMKHESEIVRCDQRNLRMKKDVKLTRKTSLYDLIKVTSISGVSLGIQTCERCFTNYNV